ncbi:Zn-ribbon domain-containing OB-fold protein [Congregibacter sp.]|uniref:Zn-ribbon domain-containing OB-fold protein n=1 Tax=Congregibacter sp. TaxID=2744308 RepID=UPI00385B3139
MLRTQPTRSAFSEPWFKACNEGRLLIQRCESCGHHQFYPRIVCRNCGAAEPAWVEASGKGLIVSFTVVRRPISEAYAAPYVVALVDLEEGPRMMGNIVSAPLEGLGIGMAVSLQFESWGDDVALPVFTLLNTSQPS